MRDSIGLRKGSQAVLGLPHSLFRPPQGQRQGRWSPLWGLGQTPAPSTRSLAGALASSAWSGTGSLPGKGGIVLFPGKCVGPRRCPGSWEAQILSVPPPPPPSLHITVPGVPGGVRASARRPPTSQGGQPAGPGRPRSLRLKEGETGTLDEEIRPMVGRGGRAGGRREHGDGIKKYKLVGCEVRHREGIQSILL